MLPVLSIEGTEKIALARGLPPGYPSSIPHDYLAYHAAWGNTLLLLQRRVDAKSFYDVQLTGKKTGQLTVRHLRPALILHFSLDGPVQYQVEGLEKIVLHERSCICYYVPFWLGHIRTGWIDHRSAIFCLPPEYVKSYTADSPLAVHLWRHIQQQKPCMLGRYPLVADHALLSLVTDCLSAHYEKEAALCLQVLFSQTMQQLLYTARPRPVTLREPEIAQLYQARDLVRQSGRTPLRLEAIQQQTGLSRYKLRQWFTMAFGVSITVYDHQLRMRRALQLLQAGDKMDHIARELGFASTNALRYSFRATYQCNPAEYLKKVGKKPGNTGFFFAQKSA